MSRLGSRRQDLGTLLYRSAPSWCCVCDLLCRLSSLSRAMYRPDHSLYRLSGLLMRHSLLQKGYYGYQIILLPPRL